MLASFLSTQDRKRRQAAPVSFFWCPASCPWPRRGENTCRPHRPQVPVRFPSLRLLLPAALRLLEAPGDGPCRAGGPAHSTADALRAVDVLRHLHPHGADALAPLTVHAFPRVQPHLEEAEPVEQGVKRPQRTDVPAEGAVDEHGRRHHHGQHQGLPAEQRPGQLP